MLLALGLVLLGLTLLAVGGEALVRGSVALARLAGLTPAVIGLTVVALGTSLPELVVSVIASLGGQPDLSVGNVVGSNIINISFILGLAALLIPLPITGNAVKVEWPVMFLAMLVFAVWSRDNEITRVEAGLMLVLLVLVTANAIRLARAEVGASEATQLDQEVEELALRGPGSPSTLAVVYTVVGIGLLLLGGKYLVDGAVRLAEIAGMSERIIGLTIVAGGTSAPEIATTVVAALRKRSDIAIANLLGSNIMNTLGIVGVAGAIHPLRVSPAMLASDLWWMLAGALILFVLLWFRKSLSRIDGAVLVGFYAVYLGLLIGVVR
ncbi:MAG: calcium/sodium antiporter [Gemmatimonadales bacterium]